MTPAFRILADKKDITQVIAANLVRLSHHDQRGFEADTLSIVIADDFSLELPRKGVTLDLHIGWSGLALVERGSFVVDEVAQEDQGDGDMIIIDCKSADMRDDLKSQKTRSWDDTTLGVVMTDIAASHSLKLSMSDGLKAKTLAHEDQTGESDLHFVTRLAKRYDAQAKVSNGYLVITGRNEGLTASGSQLPAVNIQRQRGDTHHYRASDRGSMTQTGGTIETLYRDTVTGVTHKVAVGGGTPVRQLNNTVYGSQQAALDAAKGALSYRTSQQELITLELAVAVPDLFSEMPVVLSGWRSEINGGGWSVDRIDTILDEDGLYQNLTAERGIK